MKRFLRELIAFLILLLTTTNAYTSSVSVPESEPKKATVGVYVVSIHDLNFSANTFSADFWIWADYEDSSLQPLKTMELINAKSATISLYNAKERGQQTWSQHKIQGVFRHIWDMTNFPFDRHVLTIIMEESEYNADSFQYLSDTKNSGYADDIDIEGFVIKKMTVNSAKRKYNTNFGDPLTQATSSYSQFRVDLEVERISRMLFFKIHTALYVAFLISAFCFPLLTQIPKTPQIVGSIISAIIGAIFASVINLRSADAVIGRSESLTLVDRLHFMTFFYFIVLGMLAVIILVTRERWQMDRLYRFAFRAGTIYVISYIINNLLLIWSAMS